MKSILRNIDIILFWMLLIYDLETIISIFDSRKDFHIIDLVFNIWFALLLFIIYRRWHSKEYIDSILYDLGLKSKIKDD